MIIQILKYKITLKTKIVALKWVFQISQKRVWQQFMKIGWCVLFAKNINTIKNLLQKLSGVKIFDSAIYFFSYLPSKVDTDDLYFVLCIAILSCVLASIYPSYRASKMNIVDILKNQW